MAITVPDITHRPVFHLKHDVSETGMSSSSGGTYSVEPNRQSWSLSPEEMESSLRNVVFLNNRQDVGYVQNYYSYTANILLAYELTRRVSEVTTVRRCNTSKNNTSN
jgi:hypothetical protein